MPMLIKHIDAIAREKKRDVLFVCFHPKNWGIYEDGTSMDWLEYDHNQDKRRDEVIAWFDEHHIPWQKCGPEASESGFRSYLGEIYIDVPFDENDPQYQIVCEYMENPDGIMRDENIRFYYLPLERAMKNAHHDEPGFWEDWAEKF